LTAIKQNGLAIEFSSKLFKNDKNMFKQAIESNE
jgi:hypothetical protein